MRGLNVISSVEEGAIGPLSRSWSVHLHRDTCHARLEYVLVQKPLFETSI